LSRANLLLLALSISICGLVTVGVGGFLPVKRRRRKDVKRIIHFLVPKHDLVKADGEKDLLEKYGISKEQLPKIREDDPAIQGLNAKEGDIIRIHRTDGEIFYYRLVVR